MNMHSIMFLILLFTIHPVTAEDKSHTIRSLGVHVGKKMTEISQHFPSMALVSKEFKATTYFDHVRTFKLNPQESIQVSETWNYIVPGSSVTLTFNSRRSILDWKNANPSETSKEFILRRIEWGNLSINPHEMGSWPFGLSALSRPDDIIDKIGRPEVNELDKTASGRLAFIQGPSPGYPFEFKFLNGKLESFAVIGGSKIADWEFYFSEN